MNIILGHGLDSATYPDALGENDAIVGTVITCFTGLIGILETQLGLTAPKASENIRIAEWQDLLRKQDTGNQPFSKSLATDSWNTAKELLRKRDELVFAGWNPAVHTGGSNWLETLAQLELSNVNKTWGFPDQVRALLAKLHDPISLDIDSISIVDEDETMWDPWCIQLINILRDKGVQIEKKPLQTNSIDEQVDAATDLLMLQEVLAGKQSSGKAQGDGSLLLVRTEQEWDAADYLISLLQHTSSENTVIIKGEGALFLDELLHRRGVPGAGVDTSSKWRAVLQVLPLTIDTYWEPLRVDRMMELLTIPSSPVPGKIRYRLARELAANPGIGGPKWQQAIEDGIQDYEEAWVEEGCDTTEIKKRRKNLNEKIDLWIRHEYYNPNSGIPFEKFAHICQKVSHWAATNYHQKNELIYVKATQIAEEILEGVKSLGVSNVTHLQVARILDSVLGEGAKLDSYKEEAATWQVIDRPGQIWDKVDTILWWGFHKNMAGPNIRTWTRAERSWLKDHGIYLLEEDVRRRREAAAWQRAVRFANRKLILFGPAKVKGEEIPLHPLWDEIRYAVAQDNTAVKNISMEASDLRKQARANLFGNVFERSPLPKRIIPDPIRTWRIPEQVVLPRKEESATSFEGLISCPVKWTFKYAANVKPGNILSTPNESVMLGNLGHVILETLITEKSNWNEDEVRIRVGELFDQLTPMLAAPLLEPQNGIVRNETRYKLQTSIGHFFKVLNRAGIEIQHTELEVQKPWDEGVEFKGRLDLVGETSTGKKILFDAKWSKRPANYKERLEKLSVQLSLYHWLLADHEDDELPVAYFMLRTGHFYSVPHAEFPSDYHVQGPSLIETHQIIKKSVSDVWSQLAKGTAIAPGVPEKSTQTSDDIAEEEPFVSLIDPPCKFCEYQNLCGLRRVQV